MLTKAVWFDETSTVTALLLTVNLNFEREAPTNSHFNAGFIVAEAGTGNSDGMLSWLNVGKAEYAC